MISIQSVDRLFIGFGFTIRRLFIIRKGQIDRVHGLSTFLLWGRRERSRTSTSWADAHGSFIHFKKGLAVTHNLSVLVFVSVKQFFGQDPVLVTVLVSCVLHMYENLHACCMRVACVLHASNCRTGTSRAFPWQNGTRIRKWWHVSKMVPSKNRAATTSLKERVVVCV